MQFVIDIAFISFFSLVYIYFFLSFFFKKKFVFLLFLLTFITFYDYTFINISPFVSPVAFYIIKSWQEYLLLFLLILIVLTQKTKPLYLNKFDQHFLFSFLFLTVAGSIAGIIYGTSINQIYLGWRMYLLPLLWPFLLYKTSIFKEVPAKTMIYYFIAVSIIIVFIAFYQNLTFNDNLKNLWFYDYIDKLNPIDEHPFDFVRDDKLRATSIFVSPLIYASFLSYALLNIVYYILLRNASKLKILLSLLILFLLCYGQYLSRTRIGFIILIVSLCCSFVVYFKPSLKFAYSILMPVIFLTGTFVSLLFGVTEDLSALGRLIQYASLPENFVPIGLGFGAEMTNVYFDSFYISVTLLFGVFVPLYLRLYILMLKKIKVNAYNIKYVEGDTYSKVLFYSSYGFFFSFIYTFGFHFTAGSATLQIFYLLLFYFISKFETKHKDVAQPVLAS